MNSQRRIGPPPPLAARGRPGAVEAGGSVPEMLARLEAAFPAPRPPANDRWTPVARLATLAAGCVGSWGIVAVLVHVAAPLI